jgi:hypothetical protein
LTANNILRKLNEDKNISIFIKRLLELLEVYPADLKIGIMKDIKNNYDEIYKYAIEDEKFVEAYFEAYNLTR